MGAFVKFGRYGVKADNLMQGGIGAPVDKETGRICGDGIDYNCKTHEVHPDSKKRFKGFQIPEWDKLIRTAVAGAKKAKKWNKHVGWDIAIREDEDIEIIEGNSWPDLSLMQLGDCTGRKYLYSEHINKLAKALNIPEYPEIPEKVITADTIKYPEHNGLQKL